FHLSARRVARSRATTWGCSGRVGDGEVLRVRAAGSSAPEKAQRTSEGGLLRVSDLRADRGGDRYRDLEARAAFVAHQLVGGVCVGAVLALSDDGGARGAVARARDHGVRGGSVFAAIDDHGGIQRAQVTGSAQRSPVLLAKAASPRTLEL